MSGVMSKTPLTPRIVKSGAVTIHLDLKRVFIGDQEIHVSGSEWRVLYGLARDADRWRSTDEMVCDLYPGVKTATISASERNAVRMTLTRLRKRIGVDGLIQGRPTMGYRILADQPQPGDAARREGEMQNLPDYLLDDQPKGQCDDCGRKSWDASEVLQACGMLQPNGSRCKGTMQATDQQQPRDAAQQEEE